MDSPFLFTHRLVPDEDPFQDSPNDLPAFAKTGPVSLIPDLLFATFSDLNGRPFAFQQLADRVLFCQFPPMQS